MERLRGYTSIKEVEKVRKQLLAEVDKKKGEIREYALSQGLSSEFVNAVLNKQFVHRQ